MKDKLQTLVDSGSSVEEILKVVNKLRENEIIRCTNCNHRLGDVDDGILIIKCRCGEYKNYII